MPTIAITSVSPAVVAHSGGTPITLTGTFPVGVALSVWLGPLGSTGDVLAYAGVGYASAGYSTDGTTLNVVARPSALGVLSVTVKRLDTSETVTATALGSFVERTWLSKVFSMRRSHPPTAETGARTLQMERPE